MLLGEVTPAPSAHLRVSCLYRRLSEMQLLWESLCSELHQPLGLFIHAIFVSVQ